MNRNKMYIAIGGLIALILIGLLIYLMNSESELNPKQSYTVEIYHCGSIAKDSVALKNEMSVFLLSSPIPSSKGFIAPVVNLHEKLREGGVQNIYIPMSGLSELRGWIISDYYDFEIRKIEESEVIGGPGSFFLSKKYLSFSKDALKDGDTAVNGVIPNIGNDTTEFFINTNQSNTNSADNKIWNSLASLKGYINGLIAANKITAGSVIKVYYTCGPPGPPPPPPSDMDGDGFDASKDCNDNDAQINSGINEVCGDSQDNNCDGNNDEGCNTVKGNGDNDNTRNDETGNDRETSEYTDFSIQNGIVNWSSDESEVYVEIFHNSNKGQPLLTPRSIRKNAKLDKIESIENTNDKNYFFVKYGKTKNSAIYEKKILCINFK